MVLRSLFLAARPKTLTASLAPILVGTALAATDGYETLWWVSALALMGSVFIQIATNLFNDSIDFKKGADRETRLGEARATAQNWLSASAVMKLGFLFLGFALICGWPLVMRGGWPIVGIGLLSIVLAYAYTGGPFPLAYKGFGDIFVIIFFGLVAVGGVYFLQTKTLSQKAFVAGLQVGLLATVLIAINNIRDMAQDILVNKNTLSVRLGERFAKLEVAGLFLGTFLLSGYWFYKGLFIAAFLPLLITPLAWHIAWFVLKSKPSREYNRFLALSSLVHLGFGILLSFGLILS